MHSARGGSRRPSQASSARSVMGNSQNASQGGRRQMAEPLWKTWDGLARKSGEHATVYHTNGDRYRGQYDGDMRHGQGTLLFKKGNKYEGAFENDLQHGFGTHWILKESKLQMQYRGGFAFGKRQGEGVFSYADGGKYEGEWFAGKRQGQGWRGVFSHADDGKYEGEWFAGKRQGQGRMSYPDATVYEGSWMQGLRHGPGTLFLTNSDVYQGDYAFDLKDGPGTFYYVGKNKRYDGVWSADVAKCGLFGEIEGGGEASGLPELRMLAPMKVLEEMAYTLQEQRTMELEQSGIGAPGGALEDELHDVSAVQRDERGGDFDDTGVLEEGDEFEEGDEYYDDEEAQEGEWEEDEEQE